MSDVVMSRPIMVSKAFADWLHAKRDSGFVFRRGSLSGEKNDNGAFVLSFQGVKVAEIKLSADSHDIVCETPGALTEKAVKAVEAAVAHADAALARYVSPSREIAEMADYLDPPPRGSHVANIPNLTVSDVEILSLRDVAKFAMPEKIQVIRASVLKEAAEVDFGFSSSSGMIPAFSVSARYAESGKLTSSDPSVPSPVGFFVGMLKRAKDWNNEVSGVHAMKRAGKFRSAVVSENDEKALLRYFANGGGKKRVSLGERVSVAIFPASKSACVYLDDHMIGKFYPEDHDKNWVRPGHGWSERADLSMTAYANGTRALVKRGVVPEWNEQEWVATLGRYADDEEGLEP